MSEEALWTVATFAPGAIVADRVTDWSGTWQESRDMGNTVKARHPDLEVWHVTTRAAEMTSYVPREDVANILLDDDTRLPVREHGTLAELLA